MTPTHPNGDVPKGQHLPPAGTTLAQPVVLPETLRQLRSRSPQESLGLAGECGLVRPFLLATIAAAVIFAALTIIPYYWGKLSPNASRADKGATQDKSAGPDAAPSTLANPPTAPTTPTPDLLAKKTPGAPTDTGKTSAKGAKEKGIVDALGENITKSASPRVNPLDKKDDDLLKDLDKK